MRLATFAQAIKSTNTTMPVSTISGFRYCSRRCVQPVAPGTRRNLVSANDLRMVSGQSEEIIESRICGHRTVRPAAACEVERPGAGLASLELSRYRSPLGGNS